MPPMKTFADFAAENPDKDPLKVIQSYRDETALELLKTGQYDDDLIADIDQQLFDHAQNSGLDLGEDPVRTFQSRENTQDYKALALHSDDEGTRHAAQQYQALQAPSVKDLWSDSPDEYLSKVESAKIAADQALADPEKRNSAVRNALTAGDLPFATFKNPDGSESLALSPALAEVAGNDEALAAVFEANPELDRSRIGEIRKKLRTPEGFTKPEFMLDRQNDFLKVLSADNTKLDELRRAVDAGNESNLEPMIDQVNTDLGPVPQFTDPEERKNYIRDFLKITAAPASDTENVDNNVRVLSTGQVVVPAAVMMNRPLFDKTVAESKLIPEPQREQLQSARESQISAMAPDVFRTIAANRSDFPAFMDSMKSKGASNAEVLDAWMGDPKNYSQFRSFAGGVGESVIEGFGGLALYPAALAGNESARKALDDLQKSDAERRAYAQLFGKNLGVGYDVSRLIAPVAADVSVSLLTAGAGAAAVGAKSGIRTALKETLRTALSAETKSLARSFTTRSAEKALTRNVAEVSGETMSKGVAKALVEASPIDRVLSLAGQDIARKLTTSATTASYLTTAFNRSAGATYVSLYSTLEDTMPPEKAREIALNHGLIAGTITAAVTGGFSFLGKGGIESIYNGMSTRQLDGVFNRLKQDFPKMAASVREGVDMTSAQTMLDSVVRKSVRPMFAEVAKGARDEFSEEGLDQFMGYFNQQIATGEKVNIADAVKQAAYAAMLGGVMGAGVVTVNEAVGGDAPDARVEENARRTALLETARRLDESNSPQTAAAVREIALAAPAENVGPSPAEESIPAGETGGGDAPASGEPVVAEAAPVISEEEAARHEERKAMIEKADVNARHERRKKILAEHASRVAGVTWKPGTPPEVKAEYQDLTDEQNTEAETPATPMQVSPMPEGTQAPTNAVVTGGDPQAAAPAETQSESAVILGTPRPGFANQFVTPEGATIELTPEGTASFIVPPDKRKQGIGTAAVERVKKYADATGTTITLDIQPLGNEKAMTRPQLAKWYGKLGFTVSEDGLSAEYVPSGKAKKGLSELTPAEYVEQFRDEAEAHPTGRKSPEEWLRERQKTEILDTIREELDTAAEADPQIGFMGSQYPLSAEAVDTYGITLPEGYVREGDLYVYREPGLTELPNAAAVLEASDLDVTPAQSIVADAIATGPLAEPVLAELGEEGSCRNR
jgi:GNAT superfamily N-acetyltransferase